MFCFNRWFKKDDNAVPPAYILLPISHHLPDFVNKTGDTEAFKKAKDTWWRENDIMGQTLYEAAMEHLKSEEERLKYIVSGRKIFWGIAFFYFVLLLWANCATVLSNL